MEKISLLNHILTEAKTKGACKAAYNHYERAMQSKDYDIASQIALGYYKWLKRKEVIHIACKEFQDILEVNTGVRFYRSGQTLVKEIYKNGQRHGKFSIYYESGQIKETETYKEGQLHGKYLEYYESGQIRMQASYKDGHLNGKIIEYSQEGTIIRSEIYENGKLIQTIIQHCHD